MRLWLINPYGPIPGEGWRDYRFTILGTTLAGRGHDVVWWTANFSHHFKRYRSSGWKDIPITPGFHIRLVPTSEYKHNIGLARLRFEALFCTRTYARARNDTRPDFVIGIDPPQFVGLTSVALARHHDAPLILDVFDLWPELFVLALPRVLRRAAPTLLSPLYRLRRHNFARADALVALCDTYIEVARRNAPNIPNGRTLTVFNGIDVARFRSSMGSGAEVSRLAAQLGKRPGDTWAIYAGSFGPNYDIITLLDAAELLAQRGSKIRIVVAGAGPLQAKVEAFSAKRLATFVYLGNLSHTELIRTYQVCDIGICAYGKLSNVAMPDKIYDYLAAGLPVVNSLRGELEHLLREHRLGYQYQAGDPSSLATVLESIAAGNDARHQMAEHSARIAMEFDTAQQYGRYVDLVERVRTQLT